jgi:hypothetical protein
LFLLSSSSTSSVAQNKTKKKLTEVVSCYFPSVKDLTRLGWYDLWQISALYQPSMDVR